MTERVDFRTLKECLDCVFLAHDVGTIVEEECALLSDSETVGESCEECRVRFPLTSLELTSRPVVTSDSSKELFCLFLACAF